VELRCRLRTGSVTVSRFLNRFPDGHRSMRTLGSSYPFFVLLWTVIAFVGRKSTLAIESSSWSQVLLGHEYPSVASTPQSYVHTPVGDLSRFECFCEDA